LKKIREKKKLTLPIRINILFFVVFLLFSVLILQLGMLQIVDGRSFAEEVNKTKTVISEKSVPRGRIFDRNHELMVGNQPMYSITYSRSQRTTNEEMLETAEKLAKLIDMDLEKVRDRDKRDYWLIKNPDEARDLITDEEYKLVDQKKLKHSDTYQKQLERIPAEEIDNMSDEQSNVAAVLKRFREGYALSEQIVKNKDVTIEEMSRVNEHLAELPGVDTTIDWDREYFQGTTLRSILGKVSTSAEGLPAEKVDFYRSRGYALNDRVGKSYLELQYEDLLRGQKEKTVNITDRGGKVLGVESVTPGQNGKDLVLTFDVEFQRKVEKILEEELKKLKRSGNSMYLDRAFSVIMNPHNGEILVMAGRQYIQNEKTGKYEMRDMSLGTFTTSYAMGSIVKGGTVLTGYATGKLSMGQWHYDTPMKIAGTPTKGSWMNMGNVNDLTALQKSSNVYMFKTAIDIGGGRYVPNSSLQINPDAFRLMRNHYSQFGLGVKTGIDLPGEQIGTRGTDTLPGLLMDLSIGQYDTYTPLQMAQYVSTIANGGYRVQPHILKEVYDPPTDIEDPDVTLGALYSQFEPVVLNQLSNTPEEIARVREGHRLATQSPGGTAYGSFAGASYKPAGKTGTAQAFYDGPNRIKGTPPPATINSTFISYAPHDNPEIAMVVVVPWAYQVDQTNVSMLITKRINDAYFALKKERAKK